jgi:hypothetical protein
MQIEYEPRDKWTIVKMTNRGAYVARIIVKYIDPNFNVREENSGRFEGNFVKHIVMYRSNYYIFGQFLQKDINIVSLG